MRDRETARFFSYIVIDILSMNMLFNDFFFFFFPADHCCLKFFLQIVVLDVTHNVMTVDCSPWAGVVMMQMYANM